MSTLKVKTLRFHDFFCHSRMFIPAKSHSQCHSGKFTSTRLVLHFLEISSRVYLQKYRAVEKNKVFSYLVVVVVMMIVTDGGGCVDDSD